MSILAYVGHKAKAVASTECSFLASRPGRSAGDNQQQEWSYEHSAQMAWYPPLQGCATSRGPCGCAPLHLTDPA